MPPYMGMSKNIKIRTNGRVFPNSVTLSTVFHELSTGAFHISYLLAKKEAQYMGINFVRVTFLWVLHLRLCD